MSLASVRRNWNLFGKYDPLWAILTLPEKAAAKWQPDDFFATGRGEVALLLERLAELGAPQRRRSALDFGCGVGRLTQALAPHFDSCLGVDIAPAMLRQARRYNQWPGRCRYLLNNREDLRALPSDHFDLVFSHIVLQHMEPSYSCGYIKEMLRVVAPGGAVVFQLIAKPLLQQAAGSLADAAPLPPSACRAHLDVAMDRLELPPGQPYSIHVQVENAGDAVWPAAAASGARPVQLGNHWRDARGRMLTRDDGRTPLFAALHPGGRTELVLLFQTPAWPGQYQLELDMVQEQVSWFQDRGSRALRLPVRVVGWGRWAKNRLQRLVSGPAPRMEMHGVPRPKVENLIQQAGGRLLAVDPDDSARDWEGYRYFATK